MRAIPVPSRRVVTSDCNAWSNLPHCTQAPECCVDQEALWLRPRARASTHVPVQKLCLLHLGRWTGALKHTTIWGGLVGREALMPRAHARMQSAGRTCAMLGSASMRPMGSTARSSSASCRKSSSPLSACSAAAPGAACFASPAGRARADTHRHDSPAGRAHTDTHRHDSHATPSIWQGDQ